VIIIIFCAFFISGKDNEFLVVWQFGCDKLKKFMHLACDGVFMIWNAGGNLGLFLCVFLITMVFRAFPKNTGFPKA
jgi:cytochrome bd-type quinol oxidase subunit 1